MYKVLVLDDNNDILDAVSFVLGRRRQIEIIALKDASLLPAYLEEYQPDLLLMDIELGMYDGRKLCYDIKNDPREQDLPVLLFTARHYTAKSIEDCKADAFIEKPFKIQELYQVVEKCLTH